MHAAGRLVALAVAMMVIVGCDRVFKATPAERVGYLRELVRARSVSRDTLPIDACSVNAFMQGVPAWRDSLVAAERATMVESTPCPAQVEPVRGRFVLTRWYRNWSGEYVIRGAAYPWDQGYRFTDGIYVGREEETQDQKYFAGVSQPRAQRASQANRFTPPPIVQDTIHRAGTIADTAADSSRSDGSHTPQ
jgi:hypothetical protein